MSSPPVRDEDGTPQTHHGKLTMDQEASDQTTPTTTFDSDRRTFVAELLRVLHEQYGQAGAKLPDELEERRYLTGADSSARSTPSQLLEAIGAAGDIRRLIDWVKNSFNPASIPELTTQFVVSKLGSINCPAILKPDPEDTLMPRFLLFNEHFVDVPLELSLQPNSTECPAALGKFDPARKTVVLIHGYLAGYTIVDGPTNIKNRLLDFNRFASEKAIGTFVRTAQTKNGSYVFTEDIGAKIRQQLYNVIIVDWYTGANPVPRANYIRAAVNAQVVGKLIARFLSALVVQCGVSANNLHIIAHSLGCHVSGFTGKAMNAAGHRIGKITHLDPVGLCFGGLFSQPRYRLSPDDALDTEAVHVSLNIFDNPLDGTHSNFLVNGGRDQLGCDGQAELKNSTTSSVSLLFDPAARFGPCSHMRALALFEDDHSSEPGQCQFVGYRCANYERFLAGKCGQCDAANSQCRLMSLAPLSMQFRTMSIASPHGHPTHKGPHTSSNRHYSAHNEWAADEQEDHADASLAPDSTAYDYTHTHGQYPTASDNVSGLATVSTMTDGDSRRRADRGLLTDKRERIAQAIGRLRTDTRLAIAGGLTSLVREAAVAAVGSDVGTDQAPQSDKEMGGNHLADGGGVEQDDDGHMTGTSTATPITTSTARPSSTSVPTKAHSPNLQDALVAQHRDASKPAETSSADVPAAASQQRQQQGPDERPPLGSQAIPAGSLNGPQFFLGTGAVSPYCVNYYQFRVLIAESRLQRLIESNGLAPNRLAPQYNQHRGHIISAAASLPRRAAQASGRDMLHLTVKLTDTSGHFFKGFSLLEHARSLGRVMNDFVAPHPLPASLGSGLAIGPNEPMFVLTMLLNSTKSQPVKIGETILSYYFHPIVLADRVEVNYMSNISPEIRAKYSSTLCPVAINDRHQLVRYIECHKVSAARRRK